MTAPSVAKTPKVYLDGAFVRSESGRVYPVGPVNVPRASRKDLREAVRAARAALPGWAHRTAYNRGQVLYRVAEMLEARRSEFITVLGGGRAAGREVTRSLDALVYYAGCADKLAQLGGSVNAVAGPYFTFSVPEPMGVVAVVAPDLPALQGLVEHVAAALCGGNVVVAVVSEGHPLPGLLAAELMATGDVPKGAICLLSGLRSELLPQLGSHRDIDAIDAAGCTEVQRRELELLGADSVKRVFGGQVGTAHRLALASLELKTVWHPVGV